MRIIKAFFIFFFIAINVYAGDWMVASEGNGNKSLTDKEYSFLINDMQCGVTATRLIKYQSESFEIRNLYCRVSPDTVVSIDLSYNLRNKCNADSRQLYIERKGIKYGPMIMLHCNE